MPKAMIVSVGTGTRPDVNIVNPLVKTVKDSDPALTFFLVSAESQKFAEKVAAEVPLPEATFQCVPVSNPDDIQQCFLAAMGALHEIRSRSYTAEDIIADYTSGTKAMTAGLALAAVAFRCGKLKYIYGTRENGVVVDGTEKFLSVPPAGVLAVSDVQLARQLLLELRFEAAGKILSRANDALLTPQDKDLKANLQILANAYARWDHFDHRAFCGEYGKVKWQNPELKSFKLKENLPDSQLIPLANALRNGDITLDTLADLFNNAQRRCFEGRYDDAVARLYRLVEMLAQYVLQSEYGTKTDDVQLGNPKLANLKQPALEQLERYKSRSDGKIRISLEMSYGLLDELGHQLGKTFMSNNKLRALLKNRNDSILAHGTKPATEDAYKSLSEQVLRLIEGTDGEFEARAKLLQFPWLVGKI